MDLKQIKTVGLQKDKIQQQIIDEFSIFDEWLDKYSYLIDLAEDLEPFNEDHRTEQYLIEGCQSRVWIDAQEREGKVYYSADSDAIITKGLIALLVRVLNGRTPKEIVDMDIYFIEAIGLNENLSPTRANGLVAMVKQMKLFALALLNKK